MDQWIKKMRFIHTMEYYSALKKIEILPFTIIWIYLEGIMLELNNPGTKESDLSEKSEIVRFREAESRMVVTRDWWRGNRKLFFQGIKFQLCKIY